MSVKGGVVLNSSWSFNVNGIYQVAPDRPWGFNVGANVSGREGYPSPPFLGGSARNIQVTDDIDDFRHEDIISVDARIEKEFNFDQFGLTLSLDGFNLLDEQPVLQVQRNLAASNSNLILERLSPRVFRWGVKVHFR